MRTHFEFNSTAFPPYPNESEEINPGRFGKRLAEFLAQELSSRGYQVRSIGFEDWGVMLELEHAEFPLWIGCGNQDDSEHSFQCFVEPSTPFVRKWFKKLSTEATVEKLVNALEEILVASGKVSDLRWLDNSGQN